MPPTSNSNTARHSGSVSGRGSAINASGTPTEPQTSFSCHCNTDGYSGVFGNSNLVNRDSDHADEMQSSAKKLNDVDRHYGSHVVDTCLSQNPSQLFESQTNTPHHSNVERGFGSTHCSNIGGRGLWFP